MERTNAFIKGHDHCLTSIYISDVITVLDGSSHSVSDISFGGCVCGISLRFLHNLHNILSIILNVSILLHPFKTPFLVY